MSCKTIANIYKKLSLFWLGFIYFTPVAIWAGCQPATLTTNEFGVNRECLPLCPQIYLSKPLTLGTKAECEKKWLASSKAGNEDYVIMSIISANGFGEQTVDLDRALLYADKSKNQFLLERIKKKINNPSSNVPIHFCEVAQTTFDANNCADARNQDIENHFQKEVKSFSQTLPSQQAQALWLTIPTLFNFIKQDNKVRYTLGQFGGSGATLWSLSSEQIMLNFYIKSYRQFIEDFPSHFKACSPAAELDKQLNVAYNELLKKIEQSDKYFLVSTTSQARQKLIEAEKAWITYKEAFLHFAQLYYGQRYSQDKINEKVTAYFTQRRLDELKAELKDYNLFLGTPRGR